MFIAFFTGGMPGMGELAIVAVVLILLFGAKKLPELARSIGASLGAFKKGHKAGMDELKALEDEEPPTEKKDDKKSEG